MMRPFCLSAVFPVSASLPLLLCDPHLIPLSSPAFFHPLMPAPSRFVATVLYPSSPARADTPAFSRHFLGFYSSTVLVQCLHGVCVYTTRALSPRPARRPLRDDADHRHGGQDQERKGGCVRVTGNLPRGNRVRGPLSESRAASYRSHGHSPLSDLAPAHHVPPVSRVPPVTVVSRHSTNEMKCCQRCIDIVCEL